MDYTLHIIFIHLLIIIQMPLAHTAVTITNQPPDGFNLSPGQEYSMICHHPGANTPLAWYHNSMPIQNGTRYSTWRYTDENSSYAKVIIHSASILTRGRFQCSNQDDYFDYDFRRVDVSRSFNSGDGTPIEIIHPDTNVTVVHEGGALVLKCKSGTDSQISWYRNDKQIYPGPRVIITSPENKLHVFTLMKVGVHDAGSYRCQNVANYYNRDYIDVDVIKSNSSSGVTITDPLSTRILIKKGTTFHAKCESNNSRNIEWRLNGMQLTPSTRTIITTSRTENGQLETQLRINNLQMYDGGDYQCCDRDDFLQTDRRTLVVVTPRKTVPVRITQPLHNETGVQLGGSFSIRCEAGIKARLVWRLNGVLVRPRPSLTVIVSRDKIRQTITMTLTAMNVTSYDVGRYMCQDARDSFNYDAIEMTLSTVLSAVTLHIEHPESNYVSVLPGHYLFIRCAGIGGTTVRWRHNGQVFDPRLRNNYASTLLLDTRRNTMSSMLTIMDITKEDAGVFTCEDQDNYLNSDSVGVIVPTQVNITTGNILMKHGELLQLPCQADYGTSLQWLYNDKVLGHGDGVSIYHAADVLMGTITSILTLADLKDHGGKYKCRDRNFIRNSMEISVSYMKEEGEAAGPAGAIQITTGHHIKVALGSKMTLRCKASSMNLILYWTHNDQIISGDTGYRTAHTTLLSTEQWLSLIVDETEFKHEGVYSCKANNSEFLDSVHVSII